LEWPQVSTELKEAWVRREYARFYSLVEDHAKPIILRGLRGRESSLAGLTDVELEDTFAEALGLLVQLQADPGRAAGVLEPGRYLWSMARNAAIDELRRRDREQEAIQLWGGAILAPRCLEDERQEGQPTSGEDEAESDRGSRIETTIFEGLLPELDAEPSQAAKAVRLSIARLPPQRRRVIEHLLLHGPETDAADAATALGLSATNYRSVKSRAFDDLRSSIPLLLTEMGIHIDLGTTGDPPST